jgi:hypothetical protein
MEKTQNLGLPLLVQGQLNKDITVNEAFLLIDCLINSGLESLNPVEDAPNNLADGKLILTSKTAKGVFANFPNHIAFYKNGWQFLKPKEGLILWVKDVKSCFVFNGESFVQISTSTSANITQPSSNNDAKITELEAKIKKLEDDIKAVQNPTKLGINATADANNKLTVRSSYSLFNAETSDARLVLNKVNPSSSASFIFQQNWTGIAEFGTINGNNFILKVASAGVWREVFEVEASTGRMNFKQDVLKNGVKIF